MAANDDQSSQRKKTPDLVSDPAVSTDGETRVSIGGNPDGDSKGDPTLVYQPSASGDSDRPRRVGIAAGSVLFGEYEIERLLGSGGMGQVYKARHRALQEYRAIKILHANVSEMKASTALFLREAKALLSVRHPAVVHCHDLLSDDEGRVFLIMELVDGRPLSHRLAEGPLSTDEVVSLGGRLAAGLRAAHRGGVVHRDISPDNIVLEGGDVSRAKLIDFGIAKLLEEGQGTVVDGFKGKLSYASPEQLGFFGGRIDGRSDLYSLGLVLCASALGQPISMGTTVVEAVDARRSLRGLPDRIPIGLRSALEPLLSLDPADRPEMAERLFLAPDALGHMTSPGSGHRLVHRRGNSFRRWGLGVATLLVLMAGIAYRWWPASSEALSRPGTEQRVELAEALEPTVEMPAQEPEPQPEVAQSVVQEPAAPNPLDALQIIGLLRGAEEALAENRLRRPAGNNAYQRYRAVLQLDPSNRAALQGLMNVAGRYLVLSERALAAGELEKAGGYFKDAVKVAPQHPRIKQVETALSQARD